MSTMISSPPPPLTNSLERSLSRPSLTHSSSSTIEDSQNSQLHLNQITSSSQSNGEDSDPDSLITPIDPPSLIVSIKNGSSPIRLQSTIDEEPEFNNDSPVKETKKGRLNLSKSMQTLRKKKGGEKGRERASSVGEKTPPPVPSIPTISERKSIPQPKTSAPIPTRPPMPTKQSSGFSSFLRKLTGRSNTSPAPSTSTSEKSLKDDKSATLAKRKTMLPGVSNKPTLSKIDTTKNEKGPISSISKISQTPSENKFVQSPMPITPVAPTPAPVVKETDPLKIPLPPSPTFEDTLTLPPGAAPPVDFSASPMSTSPPAHPQNTVTKKKAEAMLSFEGFEFEEEDEVISTRSAPAPAPAPAPIAQAPTLAPVVDISSDSPKKEEIEAHDVVRPLAPIRIPSRIITGGPASANSIRSSVLSSSAETNIVTPLSSSSPPSNMSTAQIRKVSPNANNSPRQQVQGLSPEKMYEGMKLAGSSPPRKAPIGTGSMGDLGRKESKWRKSVMNLSEKAKPAQKRQSAFPPPTSHDAYAAQQARIANNRQSCAPTLHSSASIAAAARGQMTNMKMSKDEQDMAETFFMS